MDTLTSSYSFDDFNNDGRSAEILRLKEQARIIVQREKEILSLSGLEKEMKILDIGCGPGFISNEIAKVLKTGFVIGIDPSSYCIELAILDSIAQNIENSRFYEGDVYDLSKYHDQFDFVYARFLFQHLTEPKKALKNILSSLKIGGILCVLDADDSWISLYPPVKSFYDMIKLSGQAQIQNGGDREIGRKLTTLLNEAGFVSVKSKIETVTTDDIGTSSFLDLILKRQYLIDHLADDFWVEYEKIKDFITQHNSWGALGVVFCTGIKITKLSENEVSF